MRRRVRIGEGIYRDQYGLAAIVKVGRVQKERRFPFDTPEPEMKGWQVACRAQLWDDQQRNPPNSDAPAPTKGTLAKEIERYAKMLEGRPSYQSERAHLRAWEPLYGSWRRARLRAEDVSLAIAQWRTDGVAAQTIIHRCRVLRQLYRKLDGPTARTPVDGVKRPPKPKPFPLTVPTEQILSVINRLHRDYPQAAARLWVLATTGQRPSHVMRTEPKDVNLKTGVWIVPTSKGGAPRSLHLNRDMRAAWKAFADRDAWGQYDTTRQARLMRRCGWPAHIRPYNARHSFAAAALEAGIDLGDVQGLLGHADIDTTRRFYAAIQQARVTKASKQMAGRLPAKSARTATKPASLSVPVVGISGQKRAAPSKPNTGARSRKIA